MNISTEMFFFETRYDDLTFLPSSIPRCDVFLEYRMTVVIKFAPPQSISCYQSHQTAIQVRGHIPTVIPHIQFIAKDLREFSSNRNISDIISFHTV